MSTKASEIVVHLGAHRTGTTSFQHFLRQNREYLQGLGISILVPDATRSSEMVDWSIPAGKVIVSEENILGTMEENIVKATLYPSIAKNLAELKQVVARPQKIFLSIRNIADWWTSAIAHCAARGGLDGKILPTSRRLVADQRSWKDVVGDIKTAFPEAELIVREFSCNLENPRWQLRNVTAWGGLKEMTISNQAHNKRPSGEAVYEFMVDNHTGFAETAKWMSDGVRIFSDDELDELDRRYEEDIQFLNSLPYVKFLFKKGERAARAKSAALQAGSGEVEAVKNTICLLHVGKTGGTTVKEKIKNAGQSKENVIVGTHEMTIEKSAKTHGAHRKVAFLFRDPLERFVSGFYSRLRQGRPAYSVIWTAAEAVSFSYFHTPNELAEALSSDDERLKSAARFAFNSLVHLKLDYKHYFGSASRLSMEESSGNIVVCCETSKLNRHMDKILHVLGYGFDSVVSDETYHAGAEVHELSNLATQNLKEQLKDDFEIYARCQDIAASLGFD